MKTLKIVETFYIPGQFGYKKGACVRVADHVADDLIARGHAIEEKSDILSRKKIKIKPKEDVVVTSNKKEKLAKTDPIIMQKLKSNNF